MRFADRSEAADRLARALARYKGQHPLILAIPRGAVPMSRRLAQALGGELDVVLVRKLRAPLNPEFAIGSIDESGWAYVADYAESAGGTPAYLEQEKAAQLATIRERRARYTPLRPPVDPAGRVVIVVDDGLATGGTARAALRAVRARHPRRLILAVPVGAPECVASLRAEADEIVCVHEPELLWAVGAWYENFAPTGDAEIAQLLDGDRPDPPPAPPRAREVLIPVGDGAAIAGDLVLPALAVGLVVFAHGSGSSRHSPRNRQVAAALHGHGLATLLLDLLTTDEELDRNNVFDIGLLARRLVAATRWASQDAGLARLPIGYFGASTGAAAALCAAADVGDSVGAVVSRGGRPDLAAPRLAEVRPPVLLIVGGRDELVLELNREAQRVLGGPSELSIVPGATHLFEEPGALEEVSRLAAGWFARHLGAARAS